MNSFKFEQPCNITYKLFSYNGDRTIYPNEYLRAHPYYPREVLSDVFIFEASVIINMINACIINFNRKNMNIIFSYYFNKIQI